MTRPADEQFFEDLLGRLDLSAKVTLLTGSSFLSLTGDERIGLPPIGMSDGPVGVKGLSMSGGEPTASLPNASLLAATWNEDVLRRVGALLADEALRQNTHLLLGPTINLHRSPRAGRLFEAYSEDPLLTGRLAAAYVRGLQERGVAACVKHFVANDSETDRHHVDVRVDETTLREVYLLPFEIAVEEGGAWALMTAYNRVNGIPASQHSDLVNGVVKGEWGFDGLVVSDFFSVHTTVESVRGGLDVVLPGPDGPWGESLVEAVRTGLVPEDVIDDHVRRLLRLAHRTGRLDPGSVASSSAATHPTAVSRGELLELAASAMTVLKNDGTLPLRRDASVTIVGTPAWETLLMGGGSPEVTAPHCTNVIDGITEFAATPPAAVRGVELSGLPPCARPGFIVDPLDGEPGMRFQLIAADGAIVRDQHVGDGKRYIGLAGETDEPGVRVRLLARVTEQTPLELGVMGLGSWVLSAGPHRESIRVAPLTGIPGEGLLAPPRARTEATITGPVTIEAELDPAGFPRTQVALIARPAPSGDDAAIADAVAAARGAEVAVVVVGVTAHEETESQDRSTLRLPGAQDRLVSAVAAVAERVVVVINAASPVLMPWADEVDAILLAGLPGQEGGRAIAAALFGHVEPTGRLTTTWPRSDGAAAAWDVDPAPDGMLTYTEGPFVGYRAHAAGRAPEPAYWFGHGLGYGSWQYERVQPATDGDLPSVQVTVRNTSDRLSREVVQLYFAPDDPELPVRLIGWSAVEVGGGESAEISVSADPHAWRRWDCGTGHWTDLERSGTLLVARGLGDIRGRVRWDD
ncbi:glycoside hydrolase family 3 C-terminal domain-containing protein [Microbacterium sp. 18062]|uniref:glycoside hydrolase family 3 protein n=1 Tax=Microbacterium sp. 18062 TaxID=2681410 RepID=UPI001359DD0E|nr:glycoside hydrolase family 3 C-terminal domain-containing protein [Microbacterium sp. 18062]